MSSKPPSLMRTLGLVTGDLWRVVIGKHPPRKPAPGGPQVVRRDVQEHEVQRPDGERLVLRRTTIDEVEVRPPPPR